MCWALVRSGSSERSTVVLWAAFWLVRVRLVAGPSWFSHSSCVLNCVLMLPSQFPRRLHVQIDSIPAGNLNSCRCLGFELGADCTPGRSGFLHRQLHEGVRRPGDG